MQDIKILFLWDYILSKETYFEKNLTLDENVKVR